MPENYLPIDPFTDDKGVEPTVTTVGEVCTNCEG